MPRQPLPVRGWPLALLVLGLACIGLATLEAARAVRTSRALAGQALRGYASFAAWSYEEHLREALRATATEVLGAVNHGNGLHTSPDIPDASDLGHYLPFDVTCACHRTRFGPQPREFFGFTLGGDTLGVGRNFAPPDAHGWLADPVRGRPTAADRAALLGTAAQHWLLDTLGSLAHGRPPEWGYHILALRQAEGPRFFAMTVMPTAWKDTIVYAADYPAEALATVLSGVLDDRGLLPKTLLGARNNRDVLSLEVSDAAGAPLFAWNAPATWSLDATSRLPATYGGFIVRLQLRPELAGQLIIGGLPRSRLPLLLVLLALAAGLTAVAGLQLRREARFAAERSGFVAAVSHELRTPLAQIRLATDTLRLGREKDPARQLDALALVDREVTRLEHLVENVLRFTRGERTGEIAPLERVDLAAESRRVVEEFAPLAASRGVRVTCSAEGAPVAALGAGSLRQVLLNLLDNAVKYGPTGQSVAVRVEDSNGAGSRLLVSDEGPGVPPEERERIWRPFQRGSAALERAVGGSGIGLTLVREIVEAHGGSVRVEPGQGRGATFVVELPGPTG
jgi:signal transduction histidine kinase